MQKVSKLLWGIALSSVILLIEGKKNNYQIASANTKEGNLALVANGEDFVRRGFVSKDGWQIDFEGVYVNITNATAYSTKSSFEPQKGATKEAIDYELKVDLLNNARALDLAAGNEEAQPILVDRVVVPIGFYNALTWKLDTANADSEIAGNTIALIGRATKDGEIIDFNLGFNQPIEYICGEFIGDERQGIVTVENLGQVEATFHFDHIFGDADTPEDDALNQDALGFQPLAVLASNGKLELQESNLSEQLSPPDYQKLREAIAGLGHVGEGHCVINEE